MQLYSSTQISSIVMELKFPKVRILVSVFNSIENMSFCFANKTYKDYQLLAIGVQPNIHNFQIWVEGACKRYLLQRNFHSSTQKFMNFHQMGCGERINNWWSHFVQEWMQMHYIDYSTILQRFLNHKLFEFGTGVLWL
jgi:hypothetical protein